MNYWDLLYMTLNLNELIGVALLDLGAILCVLYLKKHKLSLFYYE